MTCWTGCPLTTLPALTTTQGGMTGGAVVTTFFSIVTAGSQLGQAAPSLDAFARGRGSAFKIFKIIDRKPLIDPSSNEGRVLEKARTRVQAVAPSLDSCG